MLEAWRSLLRRPEIAPRSLDSYRRERTAQWFLPIGYGLLEGGFVGVIADKVYHVPPSALALITAAPMFGNLSSVFWARLAHERRKVPVLVSIQALLSGLIASVALLPDSRPGGPLLIAIVIASRLLIGGFITVRSNVWTLNYPSAVRGRVTSRLTLLGVLTMTFTAVAGGLFLDAHPGSFRPLYLGAALLSVLGILSLARVKLEGEAEALRVREPLADASGSLQLLREDPVFARYMGWQFLLGVSNMMIEPPLIYLVSRELQASYSVSILLTAALPLGVGVLMLPYWAAVIDRMHIVRFRVRHSWMWAASSLLVCAGAFQGSLLWVGVGRFVLGLVRGGGMLAWQLGHNDFAKPERAGLYMGVHATLTGVRGAVAPFLGMWLYVGWAERSLPGVGQILPAFSGIGPALFGLSAALSVVATFGFAGMARKLREES